jgi:hypothetical protein
MKPYIGATVLYKDIIGGGDVAFITAVNSNGTLNLAQLSFAGHLVMRQNVVGGAGVNQWVWPSVPAENDPVAAKATAAANAATVDPTALLQTKRQAVLDAQSAVAKAAPGSPAQDAAIAALASAKADLQATANAHPPAKPPAPAAVPESVATAQAAVTAALAAVGQAPAGSAQQTVAITRLNAANAALQAAMAEAKGTTAAAPAPAAGATN